MHGDAFQQSKARVKTALIYLVKESIENIKFVLDKEFGVEGIESQKRFLAAKPPK